MKPVLVATRDIRQNEEILFSYGSERMKRGSGLTSGPAEAAAGP